MIELDFLLDNYKYEKYDKENAFIGNFTKQASRVLKQWKDGLSAAIWVVFLQEFSDELTRLILKSLPDMKMSLLGALFFENVVAKIKKFLQKEAQDVRNFVSYLTEIAQLLACENAEEA